MPALDAPLRRRLYALADALPPGGDRPGPFELYCRLLREAAALRGPCATAADADAIADYARMVAAEFALPWQAR